jgi:Long-chain fatty acid transport protein
MQFWNTTLKYLPLSTLLLSSFLVSAQENSPYSRYGVGNIKSWENIANRGMGGISVSDNSSLVVNPLNPATYTGLKLTSFQAGLEAAAIRVNKDGLTNRSGYASLAYVNMGFAVSKNMGISFGLMPQSRSRYNMQRIDTFQANPVYNRYRGNGGLQKMYLGAAYRIKDFSVGANIGYSFGTISKGIDNNFEDTLKIFSNRYDDTSRLNGLFWSVGGLIDKELNENYRLKVGLSYTGSQRMNTTRDAIWRSYTGDPEDPLYETVIDSSINNKGKVVLPSSVHAGATLARGDYWSVGTEFSFSDWSRYRSFDMPDSMQQSWRFRIGGAFTPDVNSVTHYWKKMTFRAGAYTGADVFRFHGQTINLSAVTLGIGYPIRRTNLSVGQINVSFEAGSRGTESAGLVREGFTRFAIGLTLNDKWFIKRKYD